MHSCSICHRTIAEGEPSIWRTDDGDSVSVASSAEPLVVIDTPSGELWVCEPCYLGALPSSLTPAQLRELHDQFAMEYRELGRFHDAIRACECALEFGDSADTLAELASAHSELKHRSEAEALYRRALAIVPDHFIATNNLNRLLNATGNA
jgi:tetratricopeptide (TPR) repeat protein